MRLVEVPPGIYRGAVTGIESGRCTARIEVRAVPGGCRSFDYEAVSDSFGLQHVEHAVASDDALYVAFAEAPGVAVFQRIAEDAYETGGQPRFRIVARFVDGVLSWAWHWGSPGEELRERSRAQCRLAD